MILVAGELVGPLEDQSARSTALRKDDPLAVTLLQLYRDDPDPGIHAAAAWTLRFYQQDVEMTRIDRELASTSPVGDRQWYVTATRSHDGRHSGPDAVHDGVTALGCRSGGQ